MSKKTLNEFEVKYQGLTPNKAQAVEIIIDEYKKLADRDRSPLAKLKTDLEKVEYDIKLFNDIDKALKYAFNTDKKKLVEQVAQRLVTLNNVKDEFTKRISVHESNIKAIEDYIKEVREHIVETIDKENKVVTYSYDTDFFEVWLNALTFLFELSFEENNDQQGTDKQNNVA